MNYNRGCQWRKFIFIKWYRYLVHEGLATSSRLTNRGSQWGKLFIKWYRYLVHEGFATSLRLSNLLKTGLRQGKARKSDLTRDWEIWIKVSKVLQGTQWVALSITGFGYAATITQYSGTRPRKKKLPKFQRASNFKNLTSSCHICCRPTPGGAYFESLVSG